MSIKKVKLPDNSEQDIHDARIAAIDSALSDSSINPVQNNVIDAEFEQVTYLGEVIDDEVDEIPDEEPVTPEITVTAYDPRITGVDTTPTTGSTNVVTSGGIKSYVDTICGDIETLLAAI